jgi:fibronectin-binding autotransporter adhesin
MPGAPGPSGGLTKSGPRTLVLAGANNYSGGTTVLAGTWDVATANALPSGESLTIGAGGTVVLSGGLGALTGTSGDAYPTTASRARQFSPAPR